MRDRVCNWVSVLVLAIAPVGLASSAIAQTEFLTPPPVRGETIPEAFNRALFRSSGDIFQNRTLQRQLQLIIGPFPENEGFQDAQLVNFLYRDLMEQQVTSGPVLRTPDLPNPYDSSLLSNPALLRGGVFEPRLLR